MKSPSSPSSLRTRLRDGGSVYGIFAAEFLTPGFCQIAANAGADFVIFDMEHGGISIDTLKPQFAFARGTGITPLVRVPALAYHLIAPVLDAGAMGIMVPMLETREQAEKLASWCRYRPQGVRGLGFGFGHDAYSGGDVVAKMAQENERTIAIALVETVAGIGSVDEILAVNGIDVGWLGHYDLSDSMGMTAQFERPEFAAAVDKLVAAADRNKKPAGILASSVEAGRAWRKRGFRCLSYGNDVSLFQTALAEGIAALRSDG